MPVVLTCQHCAKQKRLSDQQMLDELLAGGMLRRAATPSSDLLRELLTSLADRLVCPRCNAKGLAVDDDWEDEWTDDVRCAACQALIPPERLEIFPNAKLCPRCQARQDAGEQPGTEAEYCERCGGLMTLTKRGGTGLAGYRMVCGDCGK